MVRVTKLVRLDCGVNKLVRLHCGVTKLVRLDCEKITISDHLKFVPSREDSLITVKS